MGEWFFVGAYVSKSDNEVERAEMVECVYLDWAKGEGLNTYQLPVDIRLRWTHGNLSTVTRRSS